ncbi:TolC family protein [Desulforegula conservatrix]|uniref:hypothetical protein n=1 Tax=Desulforegula conservatrix TaxID=153026 RepID=UPI0012EB4DBA|nr:hypothetical protein [Desulforegula conservatrix]
MRKSNILYLVLFFMLALSSPSYSGEEGAGSLSMTAFIRTSEEDHVVKNQKEIADYLDNAEGSTPYLNRVELRTETDEFDIDKQKYGVRFYPKGWGETKYSRMLSETAKASGRTEYEASYHEALKNRYLLVLEYLETVELIGLKEKLALVCEDRIKVLKKRSAGSLSFDISDLVEAEELLTRIRLELVGLENKKNGTLHQISLAADSKAEVNFSSEPLVRIDSVKRSVAEAKDRKDLDNINLKDRKNKVDMALDKYNLEQAKSRDYISFFEVAYDHGNYEDEDKAYSVEIGVKLPFINPDQDEITRKKVVFMKERLAFEEEKRAFSEKIIALSRSIDRLISQYEIIEQNKKYGNAQESLGASLKTGGTDPLNILKIKETLLKSDIHMVQTGYEIRNRFVEFLDVSGKLSEKPFKNYLAEQREAVR